MSVKRGPAALDALRQLLAESADPDPARTIDLVQLAIEQQPPGFGSVTPDPWLWRLPREQVSLRSPTAYALPPAPDHDQQTYVHRSPYQALKTAEKPLDEAQRFYVRHSIDVTMRGGTTSGVIYPLAICQLAGRFRLRRVGGASAGAIAACLAAAAEHGRMRLDQGMIPAELSEDDRRAGSVHQGFRGVADIIAWFTQIDEDPHAPDQFRMAQLFRATDRSRSLFRIAIAVLRRRWTALAILLLWSPSWIARILTLAILVAAPALVDVLRTGWPVSLQNYIWAAVWLATLTVLGVGLIVTGLAVSALIARRAQRRPRPLREPLPPRPGPSRSMLRSIGPMILVVGVVAVVVLINRTNTWTGLGGWPIGSGFLILVGAQFVVQVVTLSVIVLRLGGRRFGLVSGSVGPSRSGGRRLWDALAGIARPTFDDGLVPWMSKALSQLAGLHPGEVLRFGHLWMGRDFAAAGKSARTDGMRKHVTDDEKRRLVNLQLITTELVHGVPYRFPRSADDPRLYFRKSDLLQADAAIFPEHVVTAMITTEAECPAPLDYQTGKPIDDLYPLPEPCDLPVVVAMRMSLALPALFQAIPLYSNVLGDTEPTVAFPVRDDLGRKITRSEDQTPGAAGVRYPSGPPARWVERLWLSDGGITSNFPIHLFDAPLPLWPTVGINLGKHPAGFHHQDVWLPADNHVRSPATAVAGMIGFVGAIFSTARGWADTSQTFMPAFRGRIAWIKQGPGEGGANLYMTREIIASLALRGALAGARLARRFGDDAQWRRHQWMRLRVALDNLAALTASIGRGLRGRPYADLGGRGRIDVADLGEALDQAGGDPNLALDLSWFDDEDDLTGDFWAAAAELTDRFREPPAADVLREGVPSPRPIIRQTPPV